MVLRHVNNAMTATTKAPDSQYTAPPYTGMRCSLPDVTGQAIALCPRAPYRVFRVTHSVAHGNRQDTRAQ